MAELKIRIAGDLRQVEDLTAKLREWSKQWGKRKIFNVRRYDRGEKRNKYHLTLGSAQFVNYIKMKIPEG